MTEERPPLVYSCSGCSNVAQAANRIAVRMDRERLAEMSCIAGVGAGVPSLVRTAQSGRPILAIDGCPLGCCLHALRNCGVKPTGYVELSKLGLRKRHCVDLDDAQVEHLWREAALPALLEVTSVAAGDVLDK